jgi:hypothetical protein
MDQIGLTTIRENEKVTGIRIVDGILCSDARRLHVRRMKHHVAEKQTRKKLNWLFSWHELLIVVPETFLGIGMHVLCSVSDSESTNGTADIDINTNA